MSKMKEHFEEAAGFHKSAAEEHATIGSHHHAMARAADDDEMAAHHKAMGKAHEKLAKLHADHASHNMEMCDAAESSIAGDINDMTRDQPYARTKGSEDLSKLRPDNVRSVLPYAPPYGSAIPDGVTPVPRIGQPTLPVRPNIEPEFIKILGDPSGQDEERQL